MNRMRFIATLESDTVVSERPATTGGHTSLDYIPGACFLGACAAALYDRLAGDAFAVFHSGQVRFGNAYPLDDDGCEALPIPLSWHHPKGSAWQKGGRMVTESVHNLLHAPKERLGAWEREGIQPKQLRAGFFSTSGRLVQPQSSYRMKTAIDRESINRAAESQLFGYESLAAGSRWYFDVETDAAIFAGVADQIARALTDASIRVGRSRSAEYGQVSVTGLAQQAAEMWPPVEAEQVHIYCLSDLSLTDRRTGGPTLTPSPEAFGLAEARFLPDRSYIRARSYAPFNGKRRLSDFERQVICKGSVITFTRPASLDLNALQQQLAGGIGSYRYDGLGKVLVNPAFIIGEHLATRAGRTLATSGKTAIVATVPPLAGWLTERRQEQERAILLKELVERWFKEIKLVDGAPSNAQWSQLRQIALQAKTRQEYEDRLFGKKGLCTHGVGRKQWEKEFRFGSGWCSYASFLKGQLIDHKDYTDADLQHLLWLLGNRAPRLRNQGRKEGR